MLKAGFTREASSAQMLEATVFGAGTTPLVPGWKPLPTSACSAGIDLILANPQGDIRQDGAPTDMEV